MLKIVELQRKGVTALMEDQSMGFSWTQKAAKEILRQGFDPLYGARPLRRTIQKLIENPISTRIIQRKLQEGNSVVVDFDLENFVFNIESIEMIPESKLKEKSLRKIICTKSRHTFDT